MVIKTLQEIYEDPEPGDVLVIVGDRMDAHQQASAPGSAVVAGATVIVRFRARAMWARIVEFVPGAGHRVELLMVVDELVATQDGPR